MAAPIADFAWGAVAPDDTAFILYTGGITGRSKGVLHTHRAIALRQKYWGDQVRQVNRGAQ